jgi:hypothetical protein
MPDATAAVIGGSQVIGGIMGNRAASKQAAAMGQQAAAQVEAARIAAEEARFRPVGITTRFGSATPQFTGGRLSGYDYQASPELSALQDQLSRIYGSSLGQAERVAGLQPQLESAGQGLFGLGSQFIPTGTTPELTASEQEYLQSIRGLGRGLTTDLSATPSEDVLEQQARLRGFAGQLAPTSTTPELTTAEQQYLSRVGRAGEDILGGMSTQAASDVARQQQRLEGLAGQVTPTSYDPTAAAQSYYEEQQALLDPSRRRQEQRLAAGVFGRGRGGLSVGAEGQPELFALGQSYAEQDARLAAEARQRARQELQQDIGLGTQLGSQALTTGQAGRQEQLGLTSSGLGYLQQQPTAEETARQRMIQNILTSAQLGGQGIQTGQAGQQFKTAQALQGIGLLGQATTPEEAARQRMLQNIGTGAGLYTQGAGLFGTGYGLQQAALSPFQTQFGLAGQLEETAQSPMQIGAALGAKTSQFGGVAGQILQGGQTAAANLQSQAAQARAAQGAGMAQGVAGLGQQYYQQQQYNDWLNRAYPRTPAPIESRPVGGTTTIQQNTIPIWGG